MIQDGYWKKELSTSIRMLKFWKWVPTVCDTGYIKHKANKHILLMAVAARKMMDDDLRAKNELEQSPLPMPELPLVDYRISVTEYPFTEDKDWIVPGRIIKKIKIELESAINELCVDLAHHICELFGAESNTSLAQLLRRNYQNEWASKRQKSFDYCTNAFLEYSSTVNEEELDCNVIVYLSKSLTGFELMYWGDNHEAEFLGKLKSIKEKLDSYESKNVLGENETRMTLKTSNGREKSVVFDRSELNPLSQAIKNKINATFNNYGLAVTYDDKVQVLLSIIEELMEGN